MPLYEFRCSACGHEFEKLTRTYEAPEVKCPSCGSERVERVISFPAVRMGGSSGPSSEHSAQHDEVKYYRGKKEYERAAKAAEKSGKKEWEVKDLYRQAGKKV